MSTLREAAQQALDRLRMYYYGTGFAEDAECIAALERALARKQAEPTGKQSLQVDHGLNMNTPQAAQRLLDALAAAMPHAPLCGEFDRVADAADDLRAALKREEEALALEESCTPQTCQLVRSVRRAAPKRGNDGEPIQRAATKQAVRLHG